MRYPESLKKGQTVGFVAPSFGASIEPYASLFKEAVSNFEKLGYKTLLGPNCFEDKGVGISNTPEACGKELTDYYCSPDCDVLIAVGGGECMIDTVGFTDFERIKASKPKWYLGYSDNTHFTFLLNTLCDVASVYGPCASDFGQRPWHPAVQDALDVLCGKKHAENYPLWEINKIKSAENPYAGYNCTEKPVFRAFEGGKAVKEVTMQGRLIGGCVDVLNAFRGNPYDRVNEFCERYKDDGIIWFMEACDYSAMDLRRTLQIFKYCGWFKYAKGFIFGRPYHYGEDYMGVSFEQAVLDILAGYGLPIIMDADIGHLPPAMPIISGSCAAIRCGDRLTIDYEFK